jgi:hypothetical protein
MMKIFSDKRYLPAGQGHVVMLYPFWGKNPEDPRAPESGRFDRYTEVGSRFFQMTSLAEADVAVLPIAWEHTLKNSEAMNLSLQFVEDANKAGKQVIIFFWSDSDEDVPIKNSVIFRTSFYRSKRKPNEFAMPAWSEDFVTKYLNSQLPLRRKRDKPVVGFCGYAGLSLKPFLRRRVKQLLRRGAQFLGLRPPLKRHDAPIRAKALRVLSKSPLVETNFVLRDRFWSGAVSSDSEDFYRKQKLRREYVQNMVESDYILCCRGAGNFSYRLYETLCCGRIPVFIDTDCVLPYDFAIDWKKYCVWVDESELPLVAEKVAEFHNNLSPQDFVDLQQECRRLWEQWLSPEGFFANFYRHFQRMHYEP